MKKSGPNRSTGSTKRVLFPGIQPFFLPTMLGFQSIRFSLPPYLNHCHQTPTVRFRLSPLLCFSFCCVHNLLHLEVAKFGHASKAEGVVRPGIAIEELK